MAAKLQGQVLVSIKRENTGANVVELLGRPVCPSTSLVVWRSTLCLRLWRVVHRGVSGSTTLGRSAQVVLFHMEGGSWPLWGCAATGWRVTVRGSAGTDNCPDGDERVGIQVPPAPCTVRHCSSFQSWFLGEVSVCVVCFPFAKARVASLTHAEGLDS